MIRSCARDIGDEHSHAGAQHTQVRRARSVGTSRAVMRRARYAVRILGLAVAIAAVCATSAGARAVSFQADMAHSGDAGDAGLAAPLAQRWSVRLGDWVSYPIIAEGKVFVTVDPGNRSERGYGTILYALDQQTGAVAWSREIAGTYWWSNAAYDAGRVFVVNEDGLVRAFSAATGARLWESQFPDAYGFASAPVAENGRVFYSAATGMAHGSGALSQADGSVLWTAPTPSSEGMPAADGRRFYLAAPCRRAYAIEQHSGAVAWASTDGCSGGGGTYATVAGARLYTTDIWGYRRVLHTADGGLAGTHDGNVPPAVAGGVAVYIVGTTVRAVDASSGAPLWEAPGDGELTSPPLVANGTVWVGSRTGTLFGFDLRSGGTVWSGSTGSPIVSTPADSQVPHAGLGAADGLLVAAASGSVVAFGPSGSGGAEGTPATGDAGPPALGLSAKRRVSWRSARTRGIAVSVRTGASGRVTVRLTDGKRTVGVARAGTRPNGAARVRLRIHRRWKPRRARQPLVLRAGLRTPNAAPLRATRAIWIVR
jgi:outer membrane protein assembly factor BamB